METMIGNNVTHNFHATRSKGWKIWGCKNHEKGKMLEKNNIKRD
jgi:hypothetical protein